MEKITIKKFCEKYSIEDARLRAILTAFNIEAKEKDMNVKGVGARPWLYDEATVLRAVQLVRDFA